MSEMRIPRARSVVALLLPLWLLSAGPSPALGQGGAIDDAQQYADCMALAGIRAQDALDSARAWAARGGGEAAKHCAAVALIGLGRFVEAAQRLEALAGEMTARAPELRAGVLSQSGHAWLMAGEAEHASAAQSAALALDPGNVEILIDRSIALATSERYWEAIDDLNHAHDLAPRRADVLVWRSAAYRRLDAPDLAREDVERALSLDPNNVDGLFERGILRLLAGEAEGARQDWLKVIDLADGTPAAEAARANLERLEAGAE